MKRQKYLFIKVLLPNCLQEVEMEMRILSLSTGKEINLQSSNFSEIMEKNLEIIEILPENLKELSLKYNIDLIDLEDVFDLEERPRVDFDPQNGYFQIVTRYSLPWDEKEGVYRSIPIITFLKEGYCLIIHTNSKFVSINGGKQKKDKFENLLHGGIFRLLASLNHQTELIINNYRVLREITENSIFESKQTRHLKNIFHLSKYLVFFENNAKGNLIVIKKLMKLEFFHLETDLRLKGLIEDLETDMEQHYQQITIMREGLNSSLDAYGSIVGNNLNEVMKTLTILTVLLSNPILIASFYGMNIPLPFEDSPIAIILVLVISFILSIGMLYYMKRKGLF